MLMRFEPYREFDRITEELLSERRARQIPVDAYRRGNEFKVLVDLPGVDPDSIELTVEHDNIHGGAAKLTAGSLAAIQTRAMVATDHTCGNEDVFYPPLTKLDHAMPAYTLADSYAGSGLGETWSNHYGRSGFLGTFHVPAE